MLEQRHDAIDSAAIGAQMREIVQDCCIPAAASPRDDDTIPFRPRAQGSVGRGCDGKHYRHTVQTVVLVGRCVIVGPLTVPECNEGAGATVTLPLCSQPDSTRTPTDFNSVS